MENSPWCVSWHTGNFGQLLRCAIAIQIFDINIDVDETKASSHRDSGIMGSHPILPIHPHDNTRVQEGMKVIKPYFTAKYLSYFPKYLHYIKWFGSFPNGGTMHEYYNVVKGANFYKELLANIYWHVPDNGVSEKCFNIKMNDLFDNFDLFVKNFEEFFGQKLKQKTVDFLQIKRKNNLLHLENFTKNVVDSVDCLARNKSKDIESLCDYEKLLIISTYVQGNWDLTSKFVRNYNNTKLKDVREIHNFIHAVS